MISVPAGHPVGGVDYPRTFPELLEWFPDDDACLEYLARIRWRGGFACPACGGTEYWGTAKRRWMCIDCQRATSVTAGTIFHRTRTPLTSWFAAIWLLTSQKNGMSALGLQRVLGFGSYETAWAWLHKLRRAMVRPERDLLDGVVEVDQSFIGGVSAGHVGASTLKIPVMIGVEKPGDRRRLGRIRLQIAQRPASLELVEFAKSVVQPGAVIRTDGARMMRALADHGYTHEYVTGYTTEDKDSVMPGVHLVSSLLKRWLTGTLHYAVSAHQLAYYLDEYTFRFNRRNSRSRGMLFYRLIEQALATGPVPLREITKKPEIDLL